MGIFDIFKNPGQQKRFSHLAISYQDQDFVKGKWAEIKNLMGLGRPSNFRQAVLEADKLLDFVLRKMNYEGETIADRIRSSKDCYKDYQGLWDAHKVRNRLVHESQSEVMHHSAKEAIEKFEKALRDLRVL